MPNETSRPPARPAASDRLTGAINTKRPDSVDLMRPEFDRMNESPAQKTLIICAAPRTGSYELCRFLLAAGVGVPHEYFHELVAPQFAKRWGLNAAPLSLQGLGPYIDALRRRRAAGNVFATKIQYHQFRTSLENRHGEALFENAVFVHLFRPDAAAQFNSWRAAFESGIWDHSGRRTIVAPMTDRAVLRRRIHYLAVEDAGFREIFIMLGTRPIFVTTDALFSDPRPSIERIAQSLDVPVNAAALDAAIAISAPYAHGHVREEGIAEIRAKFKAVPFHKEPSGG